MSFMGLGIHVIIALFFAVHVVRTRREMYWLMILFAAPLLGSIVYFVAIYLPEMRLHRGVRQVTAAAVKAIDPGRELREAERAFELTPTAQNQMRLASALLEAGNTGQAAQLFEACLHGPFANDPDMRFQAATARMQNGQGSAAIELLEAIRGQNPEFRQEQLSLLLAQAYAHEGNQQSARAEFISVTNRYGSVEARVEYALWALGRGDMQTAEEQYRELERSMKYWNKHTKALHKPLTRRLDAALASARAG